MYSCVTMARHSGRTGRGARQRRTSLIRRIGASSWNISLTGVVCGQPAMNQSALGAYFRRMCSRMDKPKAVTAAAHKFARLVYTMLTKGQEYTNQGQD